MPFVWSPAHEWGFGGAFIPRKLSGNITTPLSDTWAGKFTAGTDNNEPAENGTLEQGTKHVNEPDWCRITARSGHQTDDTRSGQEFNRFKFRTDRKAP